MILAKTPSELSVLAVLVSLSAVSSALDNGVARTPPMGWNSWNHFGCRVSSEIMLETAQRLKSLGLHDVGYIYVNTDDCWLSHDRETGTQKLMPAPLNFPGGDKAMVNLSDYLHSQGFKFGIYGAAGQTTCAGRAGGLYHEKNDAATYASWGVDYLKYDDCGEVNIQSFAKFQAMRDALNETGRPIVYSFEPHNTIPTSWQPYIGNAWRTGHDIGDKYESIFSDLTINNAWANVGGPGSWNDADMLEVGNQGLTTAEARSHFSLWCLVKSPLLIGCDLTQIDKDDLDILLNKDLISISQDPLGKQGMLVASSPGRSGYSLPDFSESLRNALPPTTTATERKAYIKQLKDSFDSITDCSFDVPSVPSSEVWVTNYISNSTYQIRQGHNCLTVSNVSSIQKNGPSEVIISPCDDQGNIAQLWEGIPSASITTAGIVAASSVHESINASPKRPSRSGDWFKGPTTGISEPSQKNRLCGTCCGGNDTTSPMCKGSTEDGRLNISFDEISTRCEADKRCLGFSLDVVDNGGVFYRPFFDNWGISRDIKWKTWVKELGPPPPPTPPPPPGPMCLATNGTSLFMEMCLVEPDKCNNCRCTNSVRVRQLWYIAKTGQIISSYTDTPIPPLTSTGLCVTEKGDIPTDPFPIINPPKCISSAPNTNPPEPPKPPPNISITNTLQVWAGELSNNRVAIVLVNADTVTANVTALWKDVGLPDTATISVYDAIQHKELGQFSHSYTAEVASHDVFVAILKANSIDSFNIN